jgi:hypothetical protein
MTKCRTDFSACQRGGQQKRKDCIKPCRDQYAKLGCGPDATPESCPGLRAVQECRNACAKTDREANRVCREGAKACRATCAAAKASGGAAQKGETAKGSQAEGKN